MIGLRHLLNGEVMMQLWE